MIVVLALMLFGILVCEIRVLGLRIEELEHKVQALRAEAAVRVITRKLKPEMHEEVYG